MPSKSEADKKHELIRSYWLGGMSESRIAEALRENHKIEIADVTVAYHVQKIKAEMEHWIGYDAIERYTAEFARLQFTLEKTIDNVDDMIKVTDDDDLKVKLMRLKHEIIMDKMKVLQDAELPLAVKKLKMERKGHTLKLAEIKKPIPDVALLSSTEPSKT